MAATLFFLSKIIMSKSSTTPSARDINDVWGTVVGKKGDPCSGEKQITLLLRGCGLTIYDSEVKKVSEKFGGKMSFQAFEAWYEENAKNYQRTSEDGEKALGSLISQGLLGPARGGKQVDVAQLKRLLSVMGDKIPAEVTERVLRGCESVKDGKVNVDELVAYLHADPKQTLPLDTPEHFFKSGA